MISSHTSTNAAKGIMTNHSMKALAAFLFNIYGLNTGVCLELR